MSFDCQKCGACCGHEWDILVENGEDVPRRYLRSVRGVVGYASYEAEYIKRMDKPSDICAALKGSVGGACECKIYDRRPQVCREFAPGTSDCLSARAAAGLASAA